MTSGGGRPLFARVFRPRSASAPRTRPGVCVFRPRSGFAAPYAAGGVRFPTTVGFRASCAAGTDAASQCGSLPRDPASPRDRPRRPARVLGGVHRSLPEPHVETLRRRDAGHHRRPADDLRRRDGRGRPGRWHVRHGSGRPAAGDRTALPRGPQRSVLLPLVGDLRGRRASPARPPSARPVRSSDERAGALDPGTDRRGGGSHRAAASRGRHRGPRGDGGRHPAARRLRPRRRRGDARRRWADACWTASPRARCGWT